MREENDKTGDESLDVILVVGGEEGGLADWYNYPPRYKHKQHLPGLSLFSLHSQHHGPGTV